MRRGAFKSDACIEWFNNLIEECDRQAIENHTCIIDNAPVHYRLESILEQNPHVQILRLTPYSYLLNPIELLWSTRVP